MRSSSTANTVAVATLLIEYENKRSAWHRKKIKTVYHIKFSDTKLEFAKNSFENRKKEAGN